MHAFMHTYINIDSPSAKRIYLTQNRSYCVEGRDSLFHYGCDEYLKVTNTVLSKNKSFYVIIKRTAVLMQYSASISK
jgi:hypothetical protein